MRLWILRSRIGGGYLETARYQIDFWPPLSQDSITLFGHRGPGRIEQGYLRGSSAVFNMQQVHATCFCSHPCFGQVVIATLNFLAFSPGRRTGHVRSNYAGKAKMLVLEWPPIPGCYQHVSVPAEKVPWRWWGVPSATVEGRQ